MQMTGCSITWDFTNPYIPTFIILSGGKIGLIMGIIGGIIASISEGRLWAVPTKNKSTKSVIERKNLFILFSVIFVLYDVLSSFYFLNGGTYFDNSQGFLNGILTFIVIMAVTIILFSIGPEMYMLWGFETIVENHKKGIPAVGVGIGIILEGIRNIFVWGYNSIFGESE